MRILLFTDSYPYGPTNEFAFLNYEVKRLNEQFDIELIPKELKTDLLNVNNVKVDVNLSKFLKKKTRVRYVLRTLAFLDLFKELLRNTNIMVSRKKIKRLLIFVSSALITKKYLNKRLKNETEKVLLYTYWNTALTFGAVLYARKNKNIKIITRVHGHDLFLERNKNYIPFIRFVLNSVNKVIVASSAAYEYTIEKYLSSKEKVFLSRIGVESRKQKAYIPSDGVLNIVSCSNLLPLKRVPLILEGLKFYVDKYMQYVNWTHVGDGQMKKDLIFKIGNAKRKHLCVILKGHMCNFALMDFYNSTDVDLFITTTSSEGGVPVTLQEAQSFGIPVIGTNIGGVPEIVNDKVGVLLSANPSTEEIADAIYHIVSNEKRYQNMRKASYRNWEENFNAEKNYSNFLKMLTKLT